MFCTYLKLKIFLKFTQRVAFGFFLSFDDVKIANIGPKLKEN